MKNVLPLIPPEMDNPFAKVNCMTLSEAEQTSLISLAITTLELRHRPGQELTSPDATRDYLRLCLGDRKNEVFGALFLDNKHRVICNEELFTGSISSASVYPRVVMQRVLECNANALMLYHNHPSGDPEPSQADISITKRITEVLQLIDVRVLDHFVVGSQGSVAFTERGLL